MPDPASYGDAFADVYDDWYGDVSDAAATARFVAGEASVPSVLELGCGTGRLARAIGALGLTVVGLDASAAMAARAAPDVGVVVGDMVRPPVRAGAGFGLVLIGFNTLFNVDGDADQTAVLRGAAGSLAEGGVLVVETFVPGTGAGAAEVTVARAAPGEITFLEAATDASSQRTTGCHVTVMGGAVVRRPWRIHWRLPAELDAMAAAAGLRLRARFGDWHRSPIDSDSSVAVSVYERDGGPSLQSGG